MLVVVRKGQDGTGRNWHFNLTFQVTCDRQVSQFLRCLIIDCLGFLRDHLGSTGPVINTFFDHTAFGKKKLVKNVSWKRYSIFTFLFYCNVIIMNTKNCLRTKQRICLIQWPNGSLKNLPEENVPKAFTSPSVTGFSWSPALMIRYLPVGYGAPGIHQKLLFYILTQPKFVDQVFSAFLGLIS